MDIMLSEIFPIGELSDYKVHFAKWSKDANREPLDAFTTDRQEWQGWQEFKALRNDFNKPLIFSLANFYHEPQTWLFGGIFRVLARNQKSYKVELTDIGASFIGRLKLASPYNSRAVRVRMDGQYESFVVKEILPEPYAGRPFATLEDIDISFSEMETLVRNGRMDWKTALESVKGIYLITDRKTTKRYVGSASSEGGVWSRWVAYVKTGHGGNVEMRRIFANHGLEYCRANFQFALLEHRQTRTSDELIRSRENFWKKLLLSRGEQGLNRN